MACDSGFVFYDLLGIHKYQGIWPQLESRGVTTRSQMRTNITFQAVSTVISGTVGIGNIGGVAVAIGIGGPGVAFWLFFAGFLEMLQNLWSAH